MTSVVRWACLAAFISVVPVAWGAKTEIPDIHIDRQIGAHLLKENDQLSSGRLVHVQEVGPTDIDPEAPSDRPSHYWRLSVAVTRTYRGKIKSGQMELITIVRPPQPSSSQLVLAYGTKTHSDHNRLWGNYLPLVSQPDGTIRAVATTTALGTTASFPTKNEAAQLASAPAPGPSLVSLELLARQLEGRSDTR